MLYITAFFQFKHLGVGRAQTALQVLFPHRAGIFLDLSQSVPCQEGPCMI